VDQNQSLKSRRGERGGGGRLFWVVLLTLGLSPPKPGKKNRKNKKFDDISLFFRKGMATESEANPDPQEHLEVN